MTTRPVVSFVLATYERMEVVARTVGMIENCGLGRGEFEIIVVDNASTDDTRALIETRVDRLIKLSRNKGSCAKEYGVDVARGEFIVFLDDDSYPQPGSIEQMIRHFGRDARLGCAGFQVHLPDGERESSALPDVFVGCGVGFRTSALRDVGGLDRSFFMQAEEYDLAFRLSNAGWTVKLFDDLHVDHLKTSTARRSGRTTYYDVRNNLRVAARFLPDEAFHIYRVDWLERYEWIAERNGHKSAFWRGKRVGLLRGMWERLAHSQHRLSAAAFEKFFRWDEVAQRMRGLYDEGHRRILLADLGKNIYAFVRGARMAGLEIMGILDERFVGQRYRGISVLSNGDCRLSIGCDFDVIVVSNMSPVHSLRTFQKMRGSTDKPVISWFHADSPRPKKQILLAHQCQTDDMSVVHSMG